MLGKSFKTMLKDKIFELNSDCVYAWVIHVPNNSLL